MTANSIEQRVNNITNYEYNEDNFSRSPSQVGASPLKVSPKSTLNADLSVTLSVLKDYDKKSTKDIFKHNSFSSAVDYYMPENEFKKPEPLKFWMMNEHAKKVQEAK